MKTFLFIAITFGSIVLALAVIGATIFLGIRIMRGGISRRDQAFLSEEARMIQDIYQGLNRMEQRIEALETILLDKEKTDREKKE
jgi:phage shock protein B